ncbi:MAG TPA: hypothetical protein VLF66_04245, partial [Thermoanaerobaculia bacterium]|nr:hypothetical protein [Thermoanaerobaculia bacterium]
MGHVDCSDPDRMVCGALPRPDEPDFEGLVRALAVFERAAASPPAPPSTRSGPHALGYLISGLTDPDRLLRGAIALERAAERGRDGGAFSDLAAVFLVRGELREDPLDLLRAVSAAQAAVALDPALPEARFNLALALDQLGIRSGGRTAWLDYLEVDGASPWGGEARRRHRALGSTGHRDAVHDRRAERERALDELLPAWAAHLQAGRVLAARETLASAFDVGRALASTPPAGPPAGDASIRDTVNAIRQAPPEAQRRFARGLSAYREGLDLARRDDHQASARELERAARTLAGTPLGSWATVGRAYGFFQQGRYEEADRVLAELERSLDGERYPALLGRVRWIRGTIAILQDRPAEAFAAYHASMGAYDRAGEASSRLAVEMRWVAARASQGAREEAWRRRLEVLREAAVLSPPADLRVLHTEAGQAALESGFPEASLHFLNEALRHLQASGDRGAEVAGRRWRAAAGLRIGRRKEALEDLAQARAALSAIVDPLHRTLLSAEIEAQEGRLLAEMDPGRAVASLTAAIAR